MLYRLLIQLSASLSLEQRVQVPRCTTALFRDHRETTYSLIPN